jgi:hypothetical protein
MSVIKVVIDEEGITGNEGYFTVNHTADSILQRPLVIQLLNSWVLAGVIVKKINSYPGRSCLGGGVIEKNMYVHCTIGYNDFNDVIIPTLDWLQSKDPTTHL